MKLEDVKSLSKDDILGAFGLEAKRSMSGIIASSLTVFGVGLLVGAATALMLAPKARRELRDEVSARYRAYAGKEGAARMDGEVSDLT